MPADYGFNKTRRGITFNPEEKCRGNFHSDTADFMPFSEDVVSGAYMVEDVQNGCNVTMKNVIFNVDYKTSKKKNLNFSAFWPTLLIFYAVTATRLSLERQGSDGPLFLAAIVIYWTVSLIFSTFFIAHAIIGFTPKAKRYRFGYTISRRYIMHGFGGRIEDVIGILGTIMNGLYLLARVDAGACDEGTSIWQTQYCNPVAISNSIPHDQVLILYAIPIACQCLVRGISVEALIACWIIITFCVLFALYEVRGWPQIWSLVYSGIFMNISYELERSSRVLFVQRMQVAYSTEIASRRKANLNDRARLIEIKLHEKEALQLRSLMGNVAHDLKTPLHSLEADLEVLNVIINHIPNHQLEDVLKEFFMESSAIILDPRSILQSLNSTCKFMGMAINRSQDFMRASNNIPLVPTIETFDLKVAIDISVACINQLQTARPIITHPLDIGICSHIISDKHWLSENVLCLLSNAIKYGGSGVVDVRVKVINSTIQKSFSHGIAIPPLPAPPFGMSDKDLFYSMASTSRVCDIQMPPPSNNGEEMVLVTVEDSGIGISAEDRNNLFQPLKQTQRGTGGVGLGLFCLSKRTEALGGTAGVTSRTDGGQGSLFWFTFPYKPDFVLAKADAFIDAGSVDERTHQPMCLFKPRRILIVDDSISILKVTARLLKINGHTTATAMNGAIGLDMLKHSMATNEFDMVLTDIQMPVMNGIEATVLFRQFEEAIIMGQNGIPAAPGVRKYKRMLIVGMSASTDDHSRQEAMNAGVDFFIPKPFAYKDLQLLLSSAKP